CPVEAEDGVGAADNLYSCDNRIGEEHAQELRLSLSSSRDVIFSEALVIVKVFDAGSIGELDVTKNRTKTTSRAWFGNQGMEVSEVKTQPDGIVVKHGKGFRWTESRKKVRHAGIDSGKGGSIGATGRTADGVNFLENNAAFLETIYRDADDVI